MDFIKGDVNSTKLITPILPRPLNSHFGCSVFILDVNDFIDEDEGVDSDFITRKGCYAQDKDVLAK